MKISPITLSLLCLFTGILSAQPPGTGSLPPLPAHPRLLITDPEIPAIKARIEKDPVLKARYSAMVKKADEWVLKKTGLPERGGQWGHYYACADDGARLVTVSSATHKCPVCGRVYTGWPYDDVLLGNIHNSYSAAVRDLGFIYRLTSQRKYADKAREILLAYAERYRAYPLHDIKGKDTASAGRVMAQTLDESTWLIPMCQGADLIWDRLSGADRKRLAEGLFRPAAQVILRHKMEIHNIQCWKNSAVALAGLLLGDEALVSDALASEHGFYAQIAKGINGDGQWYEGSWTYHFYTMSAVAPLAEAGRRCGLDIYGYTAGGNSYYRMFKAPLEFALPDMTLPAFNDSSAVNLLSEAPLYELGLAHYGDTAFAGILGGTKRDSLQALIAGVYPLPASATQTEPGSRNYTGAGYAVLRKGKGKNATWLCLKYGPHGGGHGHPDKLNFILYSSAAILGFDPGTGLYGAPIHGQWRRTSIAHNTLVVDEADQAPATGSSLAFISTSSWSGVLADAGPIYPGVAYRRAVALIGRELVLVLDMVSADKEHTFDLAYHNTGEWTAKLQGEAVRMPDKIGYKYLSGMTAVAGPLPLVRSGRLDVGISVAALQPARVWAGTGAGTTADVRVPCVVARIHGKEAAVAWAIYIGDRLPSVKISATGAGFAAEASAGGRTYRLIASPDAKDKLSLEQE